MQATMLPMSTLKDLDNICNNFLWGEEEGRKKLHLINKPPTFLCKTSGDMGIRSLAYDYIRSKYLYNNHVTQFENGSVIWYNIGVGWGLINQNSVWNLGDGKSINF